MPDAASSTTRGSVNPVKWIALLGRQDMPTDGIADYCLFLARGLAPQGVELEQVRVPWAEIGWIGALRRLRRESATWRGQWVLLQYTALSWSRRGFPFGAVAALSILRRRGVRCAVVFHEPNRQGGSGLLCGIRGVSQDWVIRRLHRWATKSIFTAPLETVTWLAKEEDKAAFIPIGANIPEGEHRRAEPGLGTKEKTVIVFGVTGSSAAAAREVSDISSVMLEACKALGSLRLVVVGRGADEARELLEMAFRGRDVEVVVRGILPAEEIAREFESADALLFVRGAITTRRGSAMAGIASGVPIVGYRGGSAGGPLDDAGVEWSSSHDRQSLTRGLIRVLSDPQRWMELHERNVEVQKNYFSWGRIAERFRAELPG
jgi:glycosyltransferase involved in cell wall biosynthesis